MTKSSGIATENLRKVIVLADSSTMYIGWNEDSESLKTLILGQDGEISQKNGQDLLWRLCQGEVIDPGMYQIPESHFPPLFMMRWAVDEVFSQTMPLGHAWRVFKAAAWGMHGEELPEEFPVGDRRPLIPVVGELLASAYSRAVQLRRPSGGEDIAPRHIAMTCENDVITLTAGWGISEILLTIPRYGSHESEVRVIVVAPGAEHQRAVVARQKWQEVTATA